MSSNTTCKCCATKKDGTQCTRNASVMIAYRPYCGIHAKTLVKEGREHILSIKEKKPIKQKKNNIKDDIKKMLAEDNKAIEELQKNKKEVKEEPVLTNYADEIKDFMKSLDIYDKQLMKEMKQEVRKKFGITKKHPDFENKLRQLLKEIDCEDLMESVGI